MRPKLFWLLRVCLFSLLATLSLTVRAEYYLVYSSPNFYDQCSNCGVVQYRSHHRYHHKKAYKKIYHARHHYHRGGLYVYHPAIMACPCGNVWPPSFCGCCPNPNTVRSQWGDYVVFTSRPADHRHGLAEENESSYNPDLATADDFRPDLEVN